MTTVQLYADTFMCILWILTYLLVLVGILKTGKAIMPVAACIVIFPWEFVATIRNFMLNSVINYAVIAQVGWAVLEIIIIYQLLFKVNSYSKKRIRIYLFAIAAHVCLMFHIFTVPNGMLFTSYSNTIIGVLFWLCFTATPAYPRNTLSFWILECKLIADILAAISYCGMNLPVTVMSIVLPIIDIVHIAVYFLYC